MHLFTRHSSYSSSWGTEYSVASLARKYAAHATLRVRHVTGPPRDDVNVHMNHRLPRRFLNIDTHIVLNMAAGWKLRVGPAAGIALPRETAGQHELVCRCKMFRTVVGYHCPPRAVLISRAFNSSAMPCKVLAPAPRMSSMTTRTSWACSVAWVLMAATAWLFPLPARRKAAAPLGCRA